MFVHTDTYTLMSTQTFTQAACHYYTHLSHTHTRTSDEVCTSPTHHCTNKEIFKFRNQESCQREIHVQTDFTVQTTCPPKQKPFTKRLWRKKPQ